MVKNIDTARKRLDLLTNKLIYHPTETKSYTEQSVRNGFKHLGYSIEVQDQMVKEYSTFINTYINGKAK